MLKANNLAVAVPTGPCLKGCPYCVSEMTWHPRQDETRFAGNMGKARGAAMAAGISSVMITAKGEPLGYPESVAFVKSVARAFPDIPVELQTNGLRLVGDPGLAESLAESGVNVIAVSMDDGKTMDHPGFALAVKNAARHLVVRATLVMTDRMGPYACPSAALDKVAGMGARQATFATLSVPGGCDDTEQAGWIRDHGVDKAAFEKAFRALLAEGRRVRDGVVGDAVYDVRGISVTDTPLCVQESAGSEGARSLIFQADGHLYTSWNSRGSIVF